MPLTDSDKQYISEMLTDALSACCPPMVLVSQSKTGMEIIGNVSVPYGYSKKMIPGMYFSSFVIRKDMVSFYLFPLYGQVDKFEGLAPVAMKCLKGKTCFNFKKKEQVISSEIKAMLKFGTEIWRKQGYVS